MPCGEPTQTCVGGLRAMSLNSLEHHRLKMQGLDNTLLPHTAVYLRS